MAKFCIHCGKKLKEGEVCNCKENENKQTSYDVKESFLDALKGMFVKPVDTIKKYTDEKHFNLALILVAIFGVAAALFTLSLFKNAFLQVMSATRSSFYSLMTTSIDIPYLKYFFIALIAVIAFSFIYTGLLYLVNTVMFKGDKDYKKTFSMYAVNTIITSITLLISAIFLFINVSLGLIILVLGSTLNMIYMFKGIEFLGVKDKNKHGYIYLITTVFCYIVLLIVSLIFS